MASRRVKHRKRRATKNLPVSLKFIRDVLEPGEKIISGRRLHWVYLITGLLWLLLLGVLGVAILYLFLIYTDGSKSFYITSYGYFRFSRYVPWVLAGLCFLVGIVVFISEFIKYKTTAALLTNKRLIYKVGLIRVKIDETDLSDIRGIHVDQGWLGYLLNYGKVCLDCRFIEDVHLPYIRNPYSFVKMMHKMRSEVIEEENTVHLVNNAIPTAADMKLHSQHKENFD